MSILSDFPELSAPRLVRQRDGTMRNMNFHNCGSCQVVHFEDYATWCRAERQRLKPSNFERWPEAEQSRHSSLTWPQQQTVWLHEDAWEAYFDGDLPLAEARALVAAFEPLPKVSSPASLAHKKRMPVVVPTAFRPEPNPEREAEAMSLVRPVEVGG